MKQETKTIEERLYYLKDCLANAILTLVENGYERDEIVKDLGLEEQDAKELVDVYFGCEE